MDGYVTDQQLNPGNEPGTSTLTLTGEDVSVMMDLEERAYSYPDRCRTREIVKEVLDRYKQFFPDPIAGGGGGPGSAPNQDRGHRAPAHELYRPGVRAGARPAHRLCLLCHAGAGGWIQRRVLGAAQARETPESPCRPTWARTPTWSPSTSVQRPGPEQGHLQERGRSKTRRSTSRATSASPGQEPAAATRRTVFFSETGA